MTSSGPRAPETPVRIGIDGLSERNFDLLPALYRDPRAKIRWVRISDPGEPLASLAELLEFPTAREMTGAPQVDLVIVRRAGAAPPSGLSGEPVCLTESELRSMIHGGRFDWDRLGVPDSGGRNQANARGPESA
ncbi:MAG: hypothetical protein V1774_11845 [Candidatus Eisenbacteria bacterium]